MRMKLLAVLAAAMIWPAMTASASAPSRFEQLSQTIHFAGGALYPIAPQPHLASFEWGTSPTLDTFSSMPAGSPTYLADREHYQVAGSQRPP